MSQIVDISQIVEIYIFDKMKLTEEVFEILDIAEIVEISVVCVIYLNIQISEVVEMSKIIEIPKKIEISYQIVDI